MLLSPVAALGPITVPFNPGDIINTNEVLVTVDSAGAYTYVGADLVKGEIFRINAGADLSDVFPTANQIIDALRGSLNIVTPPANELYGTQPNRTVQLAWPANLAPFAPGSSFRRLIVNGAAHVVTQTVPASGGVVLAAAPFNVTALAASTWREYLVQILNSSPAITLACNQTNTELKVTVPSNSLDLINNITPGMSVYGTNIAALTKVTGVNRDTGVIYLSLAVTATIALNPISFTPTVVIYGLRSGTL